MSYSCNSQTNVVDQTSTIDYQKVSIDLLKAIKQKSDTKRLRDLLKASTLEELVLELDTDEKKLSFWVNIYNAYILMILDVNPGLYEDRRAFFKKPMISIGGQLLSFENIEHGILRRSQNPLGLGYIRRYFRPKWERKLRVKERDYRIHFALNCGAKSCPPVGIYHSDTIDEQFDSMAINYLNQTSSYEAGSKQWTVTTLFSWFRGDFGGKKGVKRILKKYGITETDDIEIGFGEYDWTLDLNNFVD